MPTRFVEPGRLTLITFGPCEGKVGTVVDIVDQGRVVVEGPSEDAGRGHVQGQAGCPEAQAGHEHV